LELSPLVEPVTDWTQRDFKKVDVEIGSPSDRPGVGGEIEWHDAIYYFGEDRIVCGPVASTAFAENSSEKHTYLNLGEAYPSIQRFTVLIKFADRENFPSEPEILYQGHTVCVDGVIVSYEGVPHIFVSHPSQIETQ
jgi:hypothetical protein